MILPEPPPATSLRVRETDVKFKVSVVLSVRRALPICLRLRTCRYDALTDANGMDRPRSPPPTARRVRGGLVRRKSTFMLRAATVHAVTAIGIDMGKNTL